MGTIVYRILVWAYPSETIQAILSSSFVFYVGDLNLHGHKIHLVDTDETVTSDNDT